MKLEELQTHPNWSIKGYIDVTKTPQEIQRNNKAVQAIIEFQEALAKDLQNRLEKTPLKEALEKEGVKDIAERIVVKPQGMKSTLNKLLITLRSIVRI